MKALSPHSNKRLSVLGVILGAALTACAGTSVVPPGESEVMIPLQESAAARSAGSSSGRFSLGPGDELTISVYRQPDLNRKLRVLPDGTISYPFVGVLSVLGVELSDLQKTITTTLDKYFVNPEVSIEITALKSRKVTVLGEVKTPGNFVLDGPMTVLELVSAAGGVTIDANQNSLILMRRESGHLLVKRINLEQMLSTSEMTQNLYTQPGDVIYVPRSFVADLTRFMQTASAVLTPLVLLELSIIYLPLARGALHNRSTTVPTTSIPR